MADKLYGPYGYMVGTIGSSEDEWNLRNDPSTDAEDFSEPLFAKRELLATRGRPMVTGEGQPRGTVSAAEPKSEAWQWRSRFKGGTWDAWENGRFGRPVPDWLEVEEKLLPPPPITEPDTGAASPRASPLPLQRKPVTYRWRIIDGYGNASSWFPEGSPNEHFWRNSQIERQNLYTAEALAATPTIADPDGETRS